MIRRYEDSDFTAVEALFNTAKPYEFYNEASPVKAVPLSSDAKRLALFHNSELFVCDRGGVQGVVGLTPGYIAWLYVHPQYCGQGIATQLMAFVLARVSGDIRLNVVCSNTKAIGLYTRFGFVAEDEFNVDYNGQWVRVVKMVLLESRV